MGPNYSIVCVLLFTSLPYAEGLMLDLFLEGVTAVSLLFLGWQWIILWRRGRVWHEMARILLLGDDEAEGFLELGT